MLQKIGINLDDPTNGIFLRIPGNNVSAQSRHRGYHAVYSEFVKQALDRIGTSVDSYTIQVKVKQLQNNLRTLQQQGLPLYGSGDGASVELWWRYMNKLL